MKNLKVALVHDWLTGMRGGEKCLEVFCELFPKATVFTLIHRAGSVSQTIENMEIKTSYLQKVPGIFSSYRNFLPFFPGAIESFDLSGYDLVLSSSHCVAKGVRAPETAVRICYCHTPVRYAWNLFDEYFGTEPVLKRFVIRKATDRLKKWDILSNKRVDYFIATSHNVKNRIREFYGRSSDIIYPPVDTGEHLVSREDRGYYLVVSALVPYKRVDLAVKAFTGNGRRLVVIGEGNVSEDVRQGAGPNVEFLGWTDDTKLREYYSLATALIFPGEEDFGIVPLEAQAHGKPVIAYGKGGALETVVPLEGQGSCVKGHGGGATGVYFPEQTVEALNKAVEEFERNRDKFDPDVIRANALRFGRDRYRNEIREYIERKLKVVV